MTISIHAPRVRSDDLSPEYQIVVKISIHAPRVRSDLSESVGAMPEYDFNPRSPCEERLKISHRRRNLLYFNPRSPCEERLKSSA